MAYLCGFSVVAWTIFPTFWTVFPTFWTVFPTFMDSFSYLFAGQPVVFPAFFRLLFGLSAGSALLYRISIPSGTAV